MKGMRSVRSLVKRVTPERVHGPLKVLVDRRSLFVLDLGNRLRYGPGAPRMGQAIYVCPREVTRVTHRFNRKDTGRVRAGDWDLETLPIESLPKVEIVHRKLREGITWEEAGAYDLMAELMTQYDAPDGCRSLGDVERRYRELDALIDHLRRGGALLSNSRRGGFRAFGDVYIHVGRDGSPIFGRGGAHRLAIGQVLDLAIIPAQVGVVHPAAIAAGSYQRLTSDPRQAGRTSAPAPGA